jgi:hypothetical protein
MEDSGGGEGRPKQGWLGLTVNSVAIEEVKQVGHSKLLGALSKALRNAPPQAAARGNWCSFEMYFPLMIAFP